MTKHFVGDHISFSHENFDGEQATWQSGFYEGRVIATTTEKTLVKTAHKGSEWIVEVSGAHMSRAMRVTPDRSLEQVRQIML